MWNLATEICHMLILSGIFILINKTRLLVFVIQRRNGYLLMHWSGMSLSTFLHCLVCQRHREGPCLRRLACLLPWSFLELQLALACSHTTNSMRVKAGTIPRKAGQNTAPHLAEHEAFSVVLENKSGRLSFRVVLVQHTSPSPCHPLSNKTQKWQGIFVVIPGHNMNRKCHKSLKKAQACGILRTNPQFTRIRWFKQTDR